jgi:hypothetical protein
MKSRRFVARIERKRNPGPPSPHFAALNAGYAPCEVVS